MIHKESHVNEAESKTIFDIMKSLSEYTEHEFRCKYVSNYVTERRYFEEHGYFTMKKLSLPPFKGESVRLAILGPNNCIYMIENLNYEATPKDICNLLLEQFPEDFKDKSMLNKMWLSNGKECIEVTNTGRLQISPNRDLFALPDQMDDAITLQNHFYHNLYEPDQTEIDKLQLPVQKRKTKIKSTEEKLEKLKSEYMSPKSSGKY